MFGVLQNCYRRHKIAAFPALFGKMQGLRKERQQPSGPLFITVTKEGFREMKQPVKSESTGHPRLHIVLPVAVVAENMTMEASDTSVQISTAIAQNQSAI